MEETGATDSVKDLVEYLAKVLVDHPDQVSVNVVQGEHTSIVELTVAKQDIGKIIGKQGRTSVAIRTILSNVSMKTGRRFVLEIIE